MEAIIPATYDSNNNQAADKCANRVVGVGQKGPFTNAILGGHKYLLSPLWDPSGNVCSMGDNSYQLRSMLRGGFCLAQPAASTTVNTQLMQVPSLNTHKY